MRATEDQYATIAEAATLLRVAPSTVRRWIREGDVAAYRLGQRRIGLRRGGLDSLITPVRGEQERTADDPEAEFVRIRSLTPEEKQRGLEAMARLNALSDEILAERGGKPFPPSWELINEARDERPRQLG